MKPVNFFVVCLFLSAAKIISGQNLAVNAGEKETIQIQWLFQFGEMGTDTSQFKHPQAISVDPEGAIYICDTDNHRIQKFNARGKLMRVIGGFGWHQEQFYQPYDIHARSTLDVFIADYQNQRVERYDRELNYISSLYSKDTWDEKLQFTRPIGIAFSHQRELFIIDDENSRVTKINSYGEPEMQFGDFDWGGGQLKRARQIEIASDDRIFISDVAANAIVVFDYFGNFLTTWGEGLLMRPEGIFWDESGLLFVADTGNHRFVIFNTRGELLISTENIPEQGPALLEPTDIAFYQQQIYVLDAAKACVQVYSLKEGRGNNK